MSAFQTSRCHRWHLSATRDWQPDIENRRGVRASYLFCRPDAVGLAEIGALIDSGAVRPVIADTMPLADARRAHEQSQTRHTRGKLVLGP